VGAADLHFRRSAQRWQRRSHQLCAVKADFRAALITPLTCGNFLRQRHPAGCAALLQHILSSVVPWFPEEAAMIDPKCWYCGISATARAMVTMLAGRALCCADADACAADCCVQLAADEDGAA
jgi:hypothetical protein